MKNWAGNYDYRAARVHYPKTLDEVRECVAQAGDVKALGTRHSFNDIADTSADHISLQHLDRIIQFDVNAERPTVTVEAGITYGRLCGELHRRGYALHNLASLPHISLAGACATATHGSGDNNPILAAAVAAIQIVKADGEVVEISRSNQPEQFCGSVVGLGALGVVTRLTLNLLPTFQVTQRVFQDLPLASMRENFEAIFSDAYSVSLFTTWQSAVIDQVWIKHRVGDQAPRFDPVSHGATVATNHLHPLAHLSPENCTEQLGIAGAWHDRLPHFRMDFTPSSGEELQSEYLVPRHDALHALGAINAMRDQIAPLLQVSEIRSIAADDFWMSPCYQQACIGIHFTWKPDWPAVKNVLPIIEARLKPFNARPHWGKLFTMSPQQLRAQYPKLGAFRKLMAEFDPTGKFGNAFLKRYIQFD